MANNFIKTLGSILVGLIWVYFLVVGIKNVFRYNRFNHEFHEIETQVKEAKKNNNNYKTQIQQMKTKMYWEFKVRESLGVVGPNEEVYKRSVKHKQGK